MISNKYLVLAAAGALITSSYALADYDVSPSVSGGKVVTGAFSDDIEDYVPNVRVFDFDFGDDPTQPYFIQDPGFHPQPGSGFVPGSSVTAVNFSALSYWSGTGSVNFGALPNGETIKFQRGSGTITVGSTAPVGSLTIEPSTPATGEFDDHLESLLSGGTGGPTDGIYLESLSLHSSTAGVADSLPFYLVFGNNADDDAVDAAKEYIRDKYAPGTNLAPLPEPASLSVLSLGALGLMRRRRN